jgi:two-component system, response regulator PdtaR
MAAFAFETINYSRYYIRLDSAIAEHETPLSILLDAALDRTESQTAIVYAFQPEELEVRGIAARSVVASRLRDTGVTLSVGTSRWLETLAGVVQGSPRSDANFEKFPEALQYQVKRLIVVPLRSEDRLLGALTLGRNTETVFEAHELDVATRAGRLLAAVMERDALQRKLVERKLVERAKGILQDRRRLSEEQAYLLLRNNSRRRRIPMAHLAKEIIETSQAAARAPFRHQQQPQLQTA